MDAPNAPNPVNPNAQDQFMDAVQGPANQKQAQGPTVQNPVQGPANQNQAQVPAGQIPFSSSCCSNYQFKVPHRLVKIYQFSHHHNQHPVQPAPAGIVVPTPQIIYQNWIGKKPEFSGKPEEDAESHLLSTRDWMEAHNFPEGDKVRHFCLTLIGEAGLWYELH